MYTVSINLLDGRILWFYNLATYREALQITECTGLDSSSVATVLSSSDALTLTLRATIINPNVNGSAGSALSVSLQDAFSRATSFGIDDSHIHWIDRDGGTENDVYWIDLPVVEVRSTQYRL